MADKLISSTEPAKELKQTSGSWNTADLGWPAFGVIAIICLTYLVAAGKIKGISVGSKDKKLSISTSDKAALPAKDACCEVDESVHESVDKFIEQKQKVERKITAAQTRTIRGTIERFADIFPDADPLVVQALWARFADELYLAAVENHVLARRIPIDPRFPDGEQRLEQFYVEEKVVSVQETHRRLAAKYQLPAWFQVEAVVVLTMRFFLDEFVTIAEREWSAYSESAEAVAAAIEKSSPSGARRIRRLIAGVGE